MILSESEIQRLHFTGLDVAEFAGKLFQGCSRVLDAGSGAGHFCVGAAVANQETRFHGVEEKRDLVDEARELAVAKGVAGSVSFEEGELEDLDWAPFDGVYLFNPHLEPIFSQAYVEGLSDPVSAARRASVLCESLVRKLEAMPLGTTLVTYVPDRGLVPASYVEQEKHFRRGWIGFLHKWKKVI